jgi:AraC-like DNA-binding protein
LILQGRLEPRTPEEDVRVWRCPALPDLELTVARNCTRQWRVFHETYAICIVPSSPTASIAAWRYRGREALIHNGMIGLMEPGETHVNTRDPVGGNFWVAHLNAEMLEAAAGDVLGRGSAPHFRSVGTDSPRLVRLFSRFYESLRSGATPLEQQSRLAAAVRLLLELCCERSPAAATPLEHAGLSRVREYLHAHYDRTVPLAELAAVGGISSFHLVRIFRAAYGLPPHAYQNQLRVAAVARLLRAGTPVSEIEAGFCDQSHLTRHFKRAYGVSPRRYASPESSPLPRFGC